MHEPTVSRRDAASTIFNLPGYRVIDAVDLPDVGRRVTVASTDPPGCPGCGVIATKVHSRRLQRVRDVPVAGAVEVVWAKRRWFCSEPRCGRGTFAEATVAGSAVRALDRAVEGPCRGRGHRLRSRCRGGRPRPPDLVVAGPERADERGGHAAGRGRRRGHPVGDR
uniref:Transposase family protein n=1 Tax=Janibacter limosus TaxID=53458 RepID=A0AC61U4D2_9MICO|nr:transposase family protein [Janibacter limosus]